MNFLTMLGAFGVGQEDLENFVREVRPLLEMPKTLETINKRLEVFERNFPKLFEVQEDERRNPDLTPRSGE